MCSLKISASQWRFPVPGVKHLQVQDTVMKVLTFLDVTVVVATYMSVSNVVGRCLSYVNAETIACVAYSR